MTQLSSNDNKKHITSLSDVLDSDFYYSYLPYSSNYLKLFLQNGIATEDKINNITVYDFSSSINGFQDIYTADTTRKYSFQTQYENHQQTDSFSNLNNALTSNYLNTPTPTINQRTVINFDNDLTD